MPNVDCSKEMVSYHADQVTLSNSDQGKMRERRDSGRTRLKNGLTKADHPLPNKFDSQGSYAMRTMVQDAKCDYDIDDGVYFEKEDLRLNGADLSPREARLRIRNALKDERLAYDATIKTNCTRQRYPEGYHIDIPVYRTSRSEDILGDETVKYELASGDDWVESDARAVSRWYDKAIGQELRRGESDYSQTRRITKLTKKMARSKEAWKKQTTSGICISKLVVDHIVTVPGRDDDALHETWKVIKLKLDLSLCISHPVLAGKNLAEWNDQGVSFFHACLADALEKLEILNSSECTHQRALAAWDSVFNTDYFSQTLQRGNDKAAESKSLLQPAAAIGTVAFPAKAVVPNKSSGFA